MNLNYSEYITSNTFARNSNVVFSETVSSETFKSLNKKNLFVISKKDEKIIYITKNFKLAENDVIYCMTEFVSELFNILNKVTNLKNIKLITHWNDDSIDEDLFLKKPKCISKWYAAHVDFVHKDLKPIPLGLSGDYSPKNLLPKHFNSYDQELKNPLKELLYINFQKNTNEPVRGLYENYFKEKKWVKFEYPNLTLKDYLNDLKNANFVLCPEGNGIDTHRLWETLYAGSIPVVKESITSRTLEGLPCVKVKNLEDITYDLLSNYLNHYLTQNFNYEKLKISYWIKEINSIKINSKFTLDLKISVFNLYFVKYSYLVLKKMEKYKKKIKFRINQVRKLTK